MDHKELVQNLFEYTNKFDLNLYEDFLGELCKTYDREQKPLSIEKNEEFAISLKSKIGRYTDNHGKHIDFLIFKLKNGGSIQKARHLQRNVISSYLKDYGVYSGVNHVIAVFYADNYADRRLSFVKQQFKLDPEKKKVINEFTPAKRFSFLIEKGSKNQTVRKQSLELLKASIKPNINEIEKIFSVEKVTKEFFDQYKSLYQRLLIEFNQDRAFQLIVENYSNGDSHFAENFVKKLLGQIVFLYFIQKKGRLGVLEGQKRGTGEQAFLRRIYTHCVAKNKLYFDDYLEPLFYKTLSKQRPNDRSPELNCKIPYLNGGLFEPLHNYNREGDQNMIRVGNTIFGEILDTFDTFNFTIYENDPLEQDVAVDPEMLGKIFENLLPDNERKGKGAFYTPREIVHYMCKQALIQYLVTKTEIAEERITKLIDKKDSMDSLKRLDDFDVTDEAKKQLRIEALAIDNALRDVKIVDPAVGSGAFPMGILKEIVDIRRYIRWNILQDKMIPKNELLYKLKKETLSHCIYGVDLDPGAVDIAKLRFWLSLVVDYEGDRIEPLPNLDYKIMQGNSLIENPIIGDQVIDLGLDKEMKNVSEEERKKNNRDVDFGLFKGVVDKESNDLLFELKGLHTDYFKETTPDHKKRLKNKLHDLEQRLMVQKARETITTIKSEIQNNYHGDMNDKKTKELATKYTSIEQINNTITTLTETGVKNYFPWRLHFGEVFRDHGGFDIVIGNPPYVGEKGNKEIFQEIAKGSMREFYQGEMDLFYFFFHLGLDCLKDQGNMSYITTNYFITATGGSKLRHDIQTRSDILRLINFGELKIFESALGQHNMITMLSKGKHNLSCETIVTNRKGYLGDVINNNILDKKDSETKYYTLLQSDLYSGENIKLTSGGLDDVLNKIMSNLKKLDNYCNVHKGITTGRDSIYIKNQKDIINANAEDNKYIKKWYKNSNIKRYSHIETDERVLYLTKYVTDISGTSFIKGELEKNKTILMNRKDANLKGNLLKGYYWVLATPRMEIPFEKEKIIVPQRSKINTFGYSDHEFYASGDVYFITQPKEDYTLKFLLGVLNSQLIYVWLYNRGKRKGEMLELYQEPLSQIPIPQITSENQEKVNQVEFIVDQILTIKKSDPKSDTSNLEKEIDQIVYMLYELTNEEIAIVEEGVRGKRF